MMDGIIRYTAEDALNQQGLQTLEGPGLWIRAADFDEYQVQVKQREVVLQQRLTASDQMADDMIALLRRIGGSDYQDQQKAIGEAHALFHGANRNAPTAQHQAETEAIPDFSPGNGNKARRRAEALKQNESPCSFCFALGCNGECSGDGAMGD